MEFQCPQDDAWYDVNLFFDGKKITVHYANFPEADDENFEVNLFKNNEQLNDFRRRFRPSSVQIQDHDCKSIYQGMNVCALCYLENQETKFYDALVVEVLNEEHKFNKDQIEQDEEDEECVCNYVLKWQNGPLEGERTFARINDICITPSSKEIDQSLYCFMMVVREKIENGGGKVEGLVNFVPNSVIIERFFRKLRKLRKNRYACRTEEGRVYGGCRRIESLDSE
ncbi:uncharacterized protein LOC126655533 [Mercurialis annua]|uniref:uncharacterized protein LOC126655533 n=1 Tax=Mercurialis annua TaxID=3986 RepID=UPI00215FFB32|nr:uncharacterized protein LOC126655533 [Mercurialis annua]